MIKRIGLFLIAAIATTIVGLSLSEFLDYFKDERISRELELEPLWIIDNTMDYYIATEYRKKPYVQPRLTQNYKITNNMKDSVSIETVLLDCKRDSIIVSKSAGFPNNKYKNFFDLKDKKDGEIVDGALFIKPNEQIFIDVAFSIAFQNKGKAFFLEPERLDRFAAKCKDVLKNECRNLFVAIAFGINPKGRYGAFEGEIPTMTCDLIVGTDHGVVSSSLHKPQLFVGANVDLAELDKMARQLAKKHGFIK